jgi:hypothetical protein
MPGLSADPAMGLMPSVAMVATMGSASSDIASAKGRQHLRRSERRTSDFY